MYKNSSRELSKQNEVLNIFFNEWDTQPSTDLSKICEFPVHFEEFSMFKLDVSF
jgi:hypothetical protein